MTRQIRELSQDTIIVIVTAYADFEYARTALQYQVHDFLIKPITIKSVQETVCELIEMVKVKNMDRDNKLQIQISDKMCIRDRGGTEEKSCNLCVIIVQLKLQICPVSLMDRTSAS